LNINQKGEDAVSKDMKAVDALVQEIISLGGEASDINSVISDAHLRQQLAQLIAEAGQCAKNTFVLEVDHSLTREQLVKALGCDWVDLDFTENNVPLPKSDKKENITVELLHFNENISDKEATRRAKERGYRRATPREVMTLGVKHKDLQRDFPIIAAPTGRRVLYLNRNGAERGLVVDCTEGGWSGSCRFAVVREQLTP